MSAPSQPDHIVERWARIEANLAKLEPWAGIRNPAPVIRALAVALGEEGGGPAIAVHPGGDARQGCSEPAAADPNALDENGGE